MNKEYVQAVREYIYIMLHIERSNFMAVNNTVEKSGEHGLTLENRKMLSLTGITDIESFDEGQILLYTQLGELVIKGRDLHVNELSVDSGRLTVEGDIWSLSYGEKDRRGKSGLIKRALR